MANVLVVLAPGAEEIEFVTVPDVLVRAQQTVVIAATTPSLTVVGSRGIPLGAHVRLDEVLDRTFDLIYLPGGLGSATVCRDDARVQALIAVHLAAGRRLACICASPIALVPRGLCAGRRLTSHPSVRAQVEPYAAAWVDERVVSDGPLITSQGAGTALALAFELATVLAGPAVADQVARAMVATP